MPSVRATVNQPGGGNPTPEDLARAQQIVSRDDEILAVWGVNSDQACVASALPFCPLLVMPCFWPHLAVLSPCLCVCFWTNKYALEGSLTVLTNRKIYRSVSTGGCCNQNSSGDVELSRINSVGTSPLTPCGNCNLQAVVVGMPYGHTMANTGGGKHRANNKLQFMVDDEPEATKLINGAREAAQAGANAPPGYAAGIVQASAVPVDASGVPMATAVEPIVMARDPKMSVMDTIEELAKLRNQGILTEQEFAMKKAQLLQQL